MQLSACFFRVWELIRGFSPLCAAAKTTALSLPGHSGPLLFICIASPSAIRLCWVCFLVLEADPQFVVLGLLETWHPLSTGISRYDDKDVDTFPADLPQPISNPSRTQNKSTLPGLTSHCESTTPRSPQRGVSPISHSGTVLLKVQAVQIFVEGQSQA